MARWSSLEEGRPAPKVLSGLASLFDCCLSPVCVCLSVLADWEKGRDGKGSCLYSGINATGKSYYIVFLSLSPVLLNASADSKHSRLIS